MTATATRPRYETPIDRANEYKALAKFAETFEVFIGPRISETGFSVLQDKLGNVVMYAEVKTRNNTAFKYPSLNLSMRKIAHAKKVWDNNHKPTVLIVQFTDRLMFTKLYPLKKPFSVKQWGRDDRNDPQDIEPSAEIFMGKFMEVR